VDRLVVKKKAAFIALLGALAVANGCQILAGIEDRSHDAPPDAAPLDAALAPEAASDTGAPCDPLAPPARPTGTVGGTIGDLTFAGDSIMLEQVNLGYDLDHACTCKDTLEDPGSCVSASPRCDSARGVDNALSPIVASKLGGSFASLHFDSLIGSGDIDVLIRLRDYNGQDDDEAVTFAMFASNGTISSDAGADAPNPTPRRDGADTWTVDPESYLDLDAGLDAAVAKFASLQAYVRSNTLVAQAANAYLGLGEFVLHIQDATLTGDIVRVSHPFRIQNGRLSGRVAADSLLVALQQIKLGALPFCPGGGGLFDTTKDAVCAARDVVSDHTRDGRGDPCDALSVGIGFTAVEANIGPLRARAVSPTICDAGPEAYHCNP
jgi:hypothetical protein